MAEQRDLTGKRALVTGAGRGIGAGIARRLHAAGAAVVINALSDVHAGALAGSLNEPGEARAFVAAGDVTTAEGARRVVAAAVERMGGIDILVNGLGDAVLGSFALADGQEGAAITDGDVDTALAINLDSAIHCTRAAVPAMLKQGWGRVVNISAATGVLRGYAGLAVYAAAKAGIAGLTRSLAKEWAGQGVTVNAIAPGIFPDRQHMSQQQLQGMEDMLLPAIPMGRLGDPDEVGELALYLASPASDYVTGQLIAIDGGYSL